MLQLSKNQMIGLGVGAVVLVVIILSIVFSSNKQSFQEEEACKWLNGNDVVFYKLDGNDLSYTMRKINYQQLESLISQINTDLEENRLLQMNNFMNQYYDKPRFKNNIRAIKTRYNRISTLCKDEENVLKTNKNAKEVPADATSFLNLLDKYLNTVIFPYISQVKLDDSDSSNDIFNIPVPDTFKQFYEKNTPNTYKANYLSQAIENPQSTEEKTQPTEEKTQPTEEKTQPTEQRTQPTEEKTDKQKSEKDKQKSDKDKQKDSNIGIYFIIALIIVVLVLIVKK